MGTTLDIKTLEEGFVSSVRAKFGKFLDENQEAADLLRRVGRDYAQLTVQYHLAPDDEAREVVLAELRRVENTLELEADALAELAGIRAMEELKSVLGVLLNFAAQNLPVLLSAVRK